MCPLNFGAGQGDRCALHRRVEPILEDTSFGVVLTEQGDFAAVELFVLRKLGVLAPSLETCFRCLYL